MTRGEHRLSIAAGLLGLAPGADVMTAIDSLPEQQRHELRGLVDWVEQYDLEDALG
ncbi:MAG TPA: hypothetical protein VGF12_00995 [Roseateles sp.]|uniref:hypothetical protein n=1 Tax=Roseateles sp. TaxID=1971397 RepID=UPI002ED80F54